MSRRIKLRRGTLALLALGLTAIAGHANQRGPVPAPSAAPEPPRAWMGVWLEDAVDGGVEIVAVVPGGPAALAHLKPGDVILRANRTEIPIRGALRDVLARLTPGDPLEVQVLRAGQPVQATVKLVSRASGVSVEAPPAPDPPRVAPARVTLWAPQGGLRRTGLMVADMTEALRTFYGAPEAAGVLVTRAEPDKPAARAGIRVGDILVRLGDRTLASVDQTESVLSRWSDGRPLTAVVIRDAKERKLDLQARPADDEEWDASRTNGIERELLERRLQRELERLERRIEEIRRELGELRKDR